MLRRLLPVAATTLLATIAVAAPTAAGPAQDATLVGRALLAPDASAPAPFPAVPDTAPAPAPAPGARQPVGGFSALLDATGRDAFWAMPDNGFGSKANSHSFLLRVYRVQVDFETARGGSGEVKILDWITLHDPDKRVPFDIVTEGTDERLLTGGDFDLESMRVDCDGTLWFGEEFGPFLLHTDASGKVVEAPIPLPGVESPDNPVPTLDVPNLFRSNGFEALAISPDRKTLYPILEGPVSGDDPTTRRVYAFDIATRHYVERLPDYRVAAADLVVSDATMLDGRRLVILERDSLQGTAARHKRGFVVELHRQADDGTLEKRQVVDLLNLRDPATISLPGRPGDIGLGEQFSMPYVTIESVLPVGGDRLAIVNDTNFGSIGRNPNLPDPSDFIIIRVPGLGDRASYE
jgi:hypothetical protein